MPKTSGQRSNWRERLQANPSRMEQELAIKLQEDGIHSKKCQLQLSLVTQTSCLGNSRRSRVAGFNPCPLMRDNTDNDPIVPRKRLENKLGARHARFSGVRTRRF